MHRRRFFHFAAAGATLLAAGRAMAQPTAPAHDHKAMTAAQGATKPHRYDALIAPLQACTQAVSACIVHCNGLLAAGDRSLGRCQRAALDCDVVCNATLKAAAMNSNYTPSLARTAVAVMETCVKACKPHIEQHEECKACHDACLAAIDAIRSMA